MSYRKQEYVIQETGYVADLGATELRKQDPRFPQRMIQSHME